MAHLSRRKESGGGISEGRCSRPPGHRGCSILFVALAMLGHMFKNGTYGISEVGAFPDRQVSDNCYIARLATQYLPAICPPNKVWGTTGRLTAMARRQ